MNQPIKLLGYRRKKIYWKYIEKIGILLILGIVGLVILFYIFSIFKLIALFFPNQLFC